MTPAEGPASRPSTFNKKMNWLHRLERLFAPNAIHRQLYPPPAIPLRFRPYHASDRAAVLDLHDQNAAGRFPEGHRPVFEKFVDSPEHTFLVIESGQAGVVACCGVTAVSDHVHVLCYGLVARRYQGMRIGATMTLARLCFATRSDDLHFSLIFAVPQSMGYYQRFGYAEQPGWKGEDGKDYPMGALGYDGRICNPIAAVLLRRGHLIDESVPLKRDPAKDAVITEAGPNKYKIELKPSEPSQPPAR